jgi:tetratricopeptide (TPR) repeat protein
MASKTGVGTKVVGRDAQIEALLGALREAAEGRGRTLFLVGQTGMGKSSVVREVERRSDAATEPGPVRNARYATGECSPDHELDAYQPFGELVRELAASDLPTRTREAIVEAVKETAPDWLGIIPVVGPVLTAGAKTALAARQHFVEGDSEERGRAQSLTAQFLGTVASKLRDDSVLVLVVKHAQWIDGPSAALLQRVGRMAPEMNVLVLVTYRPFEVGADHPLTVVRDELFSTEAAEELRLDGLDEAALSALSTELSGRTLVPDVAAWLRDFTSGNPLFVKHLLPVLERRRVIRTVDGAYAFGEDVSYDDGTVSLVGGLEGLELPTSVASVLNIRIRALREEHRKLLQVGAVAGYRFFTSVLAEVLQAKEQQLLADLGAVAETGVIRYSERSHVQNRLYAYEFEHALLQQRFYESLSKPEQMDYHAAIARALEKRCGVAAARPYLLDIARHFERGGEGLPAAAFLVRAAETSLADGASPQAAHLAERALEQVREACAAGAPPDVEVARLRAEAIVLLLGASTVTWTAPPGEERSRLDDLLAEAAEAATATGDPALRARVKHVEGNILVATRNAVRAREALEEALALAEEADDPASRFAIMIDLGNVLDVGSLREGLAILRRAHDLYEERLTGSASGTPDRELERLFHRLEGFLGIAELDGGNLGTARELLDRCIAGLERLKRTYDLPRMLNYRAQAALAACDFDAARADLGRAMSVLPDDVPNPWTAYNEALLGKVELDAGQVDLAGPAIRAGWADTQAAWSVSLGVLVRGYLLELLLRPGAAEAELDEAEGLVGGLLDDADEAGLTYALAFGSSLAGELCLRRGRPDDAVAASERAVSILDERGDLPVVRTEEVLYRHARCLEAAGRPGDAAAFRKRAAAVVERKARSLGSDEAGARFRALNPTARALAADAR